MSAEVTETPVVSDDTDRDVATPTPATTTTTEPLVEGDLLVEDVSIDGMCGVY